MISKFFSTTLITYFSYNNSCYIIYVVYFSIKLSNSPFGNRFFIIFTFNCNSMNNVSFSKLIILSISCLAPDLPAIIAFFETKSIIIFKFNNSYKQNAQNFQSQNLFSSFFLLMKSSIFTSLYSSLINL